MAQDRDDRYTTKLITSPTIGNQYVLPMNWLWTRAVAAEISQGLAGGSKMLAYKCAHRRP